MATTLLVGTPSGRPAARSHRRWWLLAGVLLAVAAGVTGLVVALQPDTAHSLFPYDGGIRKSWSGPVGRTPVVGENLELRGGHVRHHTLTLHQVVPRVTVNTAHATVRVVECRLDDTHTGIGLVYLADLRRLCVTVRPFTPGPVDLGFPATTQIGYAVTATTPGRVRVEGADVGYSDGGRSGQQHAGSSAVLVFAAKH